MILSILEKYRIPYFQGPDPGGAAPGAGGPSTGGTPPGPSSGAPPGTSSGEAASGATPVDAGAGDGSFTLSDGVMDNGDLDGFVEPSPDEGGPQEALAEPPQEPTQQQAQPPAPKVPPAQPQPPTQPVAPEGRPGRAGPQQPLSPHAMLQQILQNRDALTAQLATQRFALSKADEDALNENAVAHIPKLLARTYFDAFTSAVNFVNQQVPTMISSHIAEAGEDTKAENAFYKAWPGLDASKHGADVHAYANAYRQMNPKASLEDAIKFVGAAVATKHGIANANQSLEKQQQRGNGRAKPFAPSMGSRATPQGTSQVDENPFAGMGMQFD
jgi:hypothetical protein